MRIWTFSEASTQIIHDLDLEDETFVSLDDIAGYFNSAMEEAQAEIEATNQDYLLTKYYLPLVTGVSQYVLPDNIYANKIRGVMYANGSTIYPVTRFRRRNNFQDIAFTDQYGSADDYRYLLLNNIPGQAKLELHPTARETAIMPPLASSSTPITVWYIRNCARIPKIGEFCNPEVIANSTSVSANKITNVSGSSTYGVVAQGSVGCYPGSIAYVTGDAVQLAIGPLGVLPTPLVQGTTYYVIVINSTQISLATTLANALAGTAITITGAGTGCFTIKVAATAAIQAATLIDIPEFTTFLMTWVKCAILPKDGDPRVEQALMTLGVQKKMMIDTLTNSIPDDDDEIQADFSLYNDMS